MSTRDSLSRFVIPFVGAAVLTAGALLLQTGRKPSDAPTPGATDRAADDLVSPGSRFAYGDRVADDGDTLLRRLRERGL